MECELDGLDHAVEVVVDVCVPEPERPKTGPAQDGVTHAIVVDLTIVVGMLSPVDFDDQPMLEADEIQVEAEQRRLTAEVEPFIAQYPQLNPELSFLRGQVLSKLAGALRGG